MIILIELYAIEDGLMRTQQSPATSYMVLVLYLGASDTPVHMQIFGLIVLFVTHQKEIFKIANINNGEHMTATMKKIVFNCGVKLDPNPPKLIWYTMMMVFCPFYTKE